MSFLALIHALGKRPDLPVSQDPRLTRAHAFQRGMHLPVLLAALAAIPAVALHLLLREGHPAQHLLELGNCLIWLAFATELGGMLILHPEPRRWLRQHWWNALVVVCTFPFLVYLLPGSGGAGALRNAHLAKLLKLGKLAKAVRIAHAAGLAGLRLKSVVVAAILVSMLVLGSLAGVIEHSENKESPGRRGHGLSAGSH